MISELAHESKILHSKGPQSMFLAKATYFNDPSFDEIPSSSQHSDATEIADRNKTTQQEYGHYECVQQCQQLQ
jgi:hypothetical protein